MRIINLRDGDAIASVMAVPASDEAEEIESVVNEGAEVVADGAAVEDIAPLTENTTDAEGVADTE